MEGCIGSWCGDLPREWDTPKVVKRLFWQHFYEAVISWWYNFLGIFTAPRETLCRWSISLCLSDGKREHHPSCSAWPPWRQLWSLSHGKAHHNYLPTTQITAAVFKLHFHHICSGFTHSRNVMFVRKMGCYLMDTATVSQGSQPWTHSSLPIDSLFKPKAGWHLPGLSETSFLLYIEL